MSAERQIRVRVQRRGQSSSLELPFAPVLIGSGSHCDVRLAPDEAAEKQLSLTPSGTSVYVRAHALEPCCTYRGQPFEELLLPSEGTFEIGALSLTVEVCQELRGQDASPSTLKTIRQVVMLAALAVGYYLALREPPHESSLSASMAPPELFPERSEQPCPQRDPRAALALAEEQFVLAEGKRERSPFRTYEGVLAVPLYESAAACFAEVGEPQAADEAREAAHQLRTSLAEALHTHQVRLEWFLGRDKHEEARREVLLLLELLRGHKAPYAQWLASLERELKTLLASKQEG